MSKDKKKDKKPKKDKSVKANLIGLNAALGTINHHSIPHSVYVDLDNHISLLKEHLANGQAQRWPKQLMRVGKAAKTAAKDKLRQNKAYGKEIRDLLENAQKNGPKRDDEAIKKHASKKPHRHDHDT
jgi:hypothetical protein